MIYAVARFSLREDAAADYMGSAVGVAGGGSNALCDGTCLQDLELRRQDEVYLDALGARQCDQKTQPRSKPDGELDFRLLGPGKLGQRRAVRHFILVGESSARCRCRFLT
jgi:hypothetical protein